jgi:putative peptidoglycan lipid II flippase
MALDSIPQKASANKQIARAAGTVMLAFVLSNVVGLVRSILISRAFGTGYEYDAFVVASRYPDLIFNLIAGGALASAFIPTFTGFLERDDRASAWKLTSSIINLVTLVLALISILSAVFSTQIVQYLAPDFSPEKRQLTITLLRILLISPTVFGISGIIMGALNAHQKFLLPALASTMLWVGYIIGLLFFVPSMGIYGLAWGAVIGAFLHIGIQLPGLLRLQAWRFNWTFGWDIPAVKKVLILMGPRLLGVAVVQLNFIVNVIIASGQPEGSASSLTYAFQIMTMPEVAIAQAIAIAALPTFSAQIARGELKQMRHSLASTLRSVLLLSLPATMGLILLRDPIITMLFQRGQFNNNSTTMVAWALLWYTAGLVGHSVVEILSRAFYALHDTKTPVLVGTAAMTLNVILSFAFSGLFNLIGWLPHGGLALANSFATALEMIGLLILMRKRLNGIDGLSILKGLAPAVMGSVVMSVVILAWLSMSADQGPWLVGLGGIILGGAAYGLCMIVLRVPELLSLTSALQRRIKRA